MSTGKRLAKRSILGTRVCAPNEDGLYLSGVIQATKSHEDSEQQSVYCVNFDDRKTTCEFRGDDLVGPGFKTVCDIILQVGQRIFVTYNGREVKGTVLNHRPDTDEVELMLCPPNHHITLKKKLEEVRLIESRKSARLQDTDTDYSRLADGQPEPRRRAASLSIDVPYGQSGRKRRSSADDGVMDDCMAAMVLMSLSCSPKSPCLPNAGMFPPWATALTSSSGASSYSSGSTRATPSPPSHLGTADEGIDMDDSEGFIMDDSFPSKRKSPTRTKVVFQCTWPGCGKQYQLCEDIERHVRTMHLGRSDAGELDSSDHEEEFYYTEIEVEYSSHQHLEPPSPTLPSLEANHPGDQSSSSPSSHVPSIYSSSVPTLSHLDMARPAHEDPEYRKQTQVFGPNCVNTAAPISIPQLQKSTAWQLHGYAASAPSNMGSPQKCMRLSPKPTSSPSKSSPLHRRTRSESRKCRKVYGMENRDSWCTQCKWKKACTRFVD